MEKSQGKTVAIVTFHSWINGNLNYGATLQAYALALVIRKAGHPVEVVDYRPEVVPVDGAGKRLYRKLFRFRISRKVPRGKRRGFERFLRESGMLGATRYASLQQLRNNPPSAEIYLAGSDQVWNPGIFHNTLFPAFFLDFGNPGRRVSYASSFGSCQAGQGFEGEMARLLSRFSAISVREESGARIVKRLLGENAKVSTVLDPTLLVDDFSEIAELVGSEGTLLAYLFGASEHEVTLLRETAAKMGLEPAIIGDPGMGNWAGCRTISCDSPSQWVGAMLGAEGIVTNSFHGTVFSILFRKPFVSVAGSATGAANRNTRVIDLTSRLGVEEQLTKEWDVAHWVEVLGQPIDWGEVHGHLAKERAASLEYLGHALE